MLMKSAWASNTVCETEFVCFFKLESSDGLNPGFWKGLTSCVTLKMPFT